MAVAVADREGEEDGQKGGGEEKGEEGGGRSLPKLLSLLPELLHRASATVMPPTWISTE